MSDSAHRCPYCAAEDVRAGPERGELSYRMCGHCGSGWLPEGVLSFRDYYEDYDPELVRDAPEILRQRYRAILTRLEDDAPGRSLLEVGCGNGHLLAEARELGWEGVGVELSRAHVRRAQERGLDVRYGDLGEDRLWEGHRFDAVVAIEVVEHVPRPRDFLVSCTQRLRPGGVLYLTTPNFGSISRRLLGGEWSVLSHEHVSLASPAGLRSALQDAGHRVLLLRGKNLFLGEYREAFRRWREARTWAAAEEGGGDSPSRAASVASMRDRIEGSTVLRALKGAANLVLGVTGLGEALECLSRKATGPGEPR